MTRAATLMSLCWLLSRTLVGIQGIAGVPPDALQQLAGAEAKGAINKPAAYEFRVEPACNVRRSQSRNRR
jgi:hypothetical protein